MVEELHSLNGLTNEEVNELSIEDVTANSKVVQIEKYITGGNLVIVKDGKKYNSKG